jgi:cell division protein FtsB
VNSRRLFFSLFVLLFAALAVVDALFFVQTREEYTRLHTMNLDNQRRLEEATARLQQQETVLQRLRTDPAYVEKVIRIRLGYAKPDEGVYRFPE